ncbi:Halomucin, partial [Bienertia sinuspersici]
MGGESLSSDSFKYKFGYNRRGRTVAEFFFNDFCSTPSSARKIGPLPTFELLTPSPTAVSAYYITSTLDTGAIVTEEISAKDISVTDNAIGDHSKHVDEGVSVSSPKDGQLIVADTSATGSIPEALEGDETGKKQNDDDVTSKNSSEHTPSPQDFGVTRDFGESLPIVTPLKVQRPHVKEYIDLVEEEIDEDYSHLESLISDVEKSIENYSITDEDIKKEFGEEVGKNVMEDVGSTKMEQVSVHNEEKEIADHKNDDSFVCETEVSKKEKAKSKYNDVSMLSIHENNPAVIQKNEELRHALESSGLLHIVNPANPDIHVCMTKTDFLSFAPKTWLTGASIDACSYLFNKREEEKPGTPKRFLFNILPFNYINWLIDERKKKEKIESIIAEKEIDLEKATNNPCYDTMKAEWLKEKQKMTYRDSTFFADKCRQSMSEWEKIYGEKPYDKMYELCHFLLSFLQGNRIKRRGFDGLHHWNRRTIPFTWRSNQNDFDCGVHCIIAMEWYDGWNEKKHLITTLSTKLRRCHLAIDLVSYKENRRKQEVFKDCALWSARKPFLIQQQKKRKDKEKHLENLRVKRVEKVFLEDKKIKKERERHEQE